MDKHTMQAIKSDNQIKKFSAYGFFKNLKFFEPYLILLLIASGLTLFEIGILYSIREGIMYIFEVPSGIIADYYGRKKELYMCFGFYIISFVLFFFMQDVYMAALAMVFFGLGEAFRSGTHKAMIYTYLEEKGWEKNKAFVYGRTRSFSLIGSALSSVLAILLILNVPSSRYIFLVTIVPYFLDLLLIMSYPESLDYSGKKMKQGASFISVMREHLADIMRRPKLRQILISASSFEAVFKSIKDYIQPILEVVIVSSGIVILNRFSSDESLKIILGISYGIIYILGATASRRAYLLKRLTSSARLMDYMYLALAACFIALYFAVNTGSILLIVLLYLMVYLLKDIRKPIFVDVCDDYMEKHQRATVLSVESQLKAIITIVLAPLVGLVADNFGVGLVMLILGLLMLIMFNSVRIEMGR